MLCWRSAGHSARVRGRHGPRVWGQRGLPTPDDQSGLWTGNVLSSGKTGDGRGLRRGAEGLARGWNRAGACGMRGALQGTGPALRLKRGGGVAPLPPRAGAVNRAPPPPQMGGGARVREKGSIDRSISQLL